MDEIFFDGQIGRIEGRYRQAYSGDKDAPIALILHPHPQHGGNMDNKIVYELYRRLYKKNFTVLRINFRGVGKSVGKFDNGVGEMIDSSVALDWLISNNRDAKAVWVGGFSFGAWIAMQIVMRRPEVIRFFSVAAPYTKYDFSFLSPCPIPGILIHGDQDSVVDEESVYEFMSKVSPKHSSKNNKIDHVIIPGADHHFRDKIPELGDAFESYVVQSVQQDVHNDKNVAGDRVLLK